MTADQLDRVYKNIYSRIRKEYDGGCSFGIDRRTISIGWVKALDRTMAMSKNHN